MARNVAAIDLHPALGAEYAPRWTIAFVPDARQSATASATMERSALFGGERALSHRRDHRGRSPQGATRRTDGLAVTAPFPQSRGSPTSPRRRYNCAAAASIAIIDKTPGSATSAIPNAPRACRERRPPANASSSAPRGSGRQPSRTAGLRKGRNGAVPGRRADAHLCLCMTAELVRRYPRDFWIHARAEASSAPNPPEQTSSFGRIQQKCGFFETADPVFG